jgi:tellurite resistance protein
MPITADFFGISLGLAALAQAWQVAAGLAHVQRRVGSALAVATAVVWATTVFAYLRFLVLSASLRTALADPRTGPSVPLSAIVLMLLGVAVAPYGRVVGVMA